MSEGEKITRKMREPISLTGNKENDGGAGKGLSPLCESVKICHQIE
jgi:hypothetical protein